MTFKLKDPHTLRIFISSPFNGMELERQRLSRLHWPRIESALASRGLQLRTVDMRWGITSESSSDSQVITICLRELDRSDIFIGFFGQRYGWHGSGDAALQDNFDKAQDRFPWVNDFRDRSVTELEFLHGHLNHPGQLPAVICFRDKAYDDARRAEGEAEGNKRTIYKFSPESDTSVTLMDDLKRRVKETESQTLGIKMCYKHPDECADFMFDKLWDFLHQTLLSSDVIPPKEREQDAVAHVAYMTTRSGLYVGGEDYFKQLDHHVDGDPACKTLTIVGEAGIGKSALISNWINHREKKATEKKEVIIPHFIGADKASSDTDSMMIRLIDEVHHQVLGSTFTRPKVKDSGNLSRQLETCLNQVGEGHQDTLLVLLVDGLNKLDSTTKTKKPLFWLPRTLPSNVKVIMTLTPGQHSSTEQLEMLQEEYGTGTLQVVPLTSDQKRQVCDELLKLNSKSLSPDQLDLLVSSHRTAQPLFLRVGIEELCVYGNFRQLTKQIENLLSSDGVAGLLSKVIERLETDYDSSEYEGKMVEEILCAICCCKNGVAEPELPVPHHMWAPLYHSLQKYLINRGGLLGFAFDEFYTAVQKRYMSTPEVKKKVYGVVTGLFHEPYKTALANQKMPSDRCVIELVHLLRQSDDVTTLIGVLSDIRVFDILYRGDRFSLLDYWRSTDLTSDVIARYHIKSLSMALTEIYISGSEGYETVKGETTMIWEQRILNSLHQWLEECKLFKGLEIVSQRWIEFELRRPDQTEVGRETRVSDIRYKQACFYCETNRYHEAIELHQKVLTVRKRLHEIGKLKAGEIGASYHGLGACYLNLGQIDESEKMFQRALDLESDVPGYTTNVSDALANLANIYSRRQDYEKAVKTLLKCIEIREEKNVTDLTIEMSYLYNNLGLAYRAMKRYDEAEVQYLKALKVKEKALGRMSLDVGYTLLNLGTLQQYRGDTEKALVYHKEALEVFRVTAQEQPQTLTMAEENVALGLVTLQRFEEAEPLYLKAYESLLTMEGKLSKGLPSLHREMVNYYAREEKFEKAGEITVALIESRIGNDRDYALLDMVDGNLPQRPKRPKDVSIDAGLKRFPDSPMLLKVKLKEVLQGGVEGLKAFIRDHCEAQNEAEVRGRRHLITGAILVTTPGLATMGLIVLEAGHEYAPDNQEIIGLFDEARTKAAAENKEETENATS